MRGVFQQIDVKNGHNEVAGDFQLAGHMFTGKNGKTFMRHRLVYFTFRHNIFTDKK